MATYLLAWNPRYWPWSKFVEAHGVGASPKADEWRTSNRRIRRGDRVFIVKVGQPPRGIFAAGHAEASPRFKANPEEGWYVPIRLSKILNPGNQPILLHSGLRSISSKFTWAPRGSGIRIPDGIAMALEPVRSSVANDQANVLDDIKAFEITARNLPETERQALLKSRIGQGEFREALLSYWKSCAVTGVASEPMLRASHIKPWRLSSNTERLDRYNGLLLIPTLDHAFDKGFISFADDGRILVSGSLSNTDKQRLGISESMKLRAVTERHQKYLAFHRTHIFEQRTANPLLYTDAREQARVRR